LECGQTIGNVFGVQHTYFTRHVPSYICWRDKCSFTILHHHGMMDFDVFVTLANQKN
jgi:hypothetical protein